jgi:hypothetical protein
MMTQIDIHTIGEEADQHAIRLTPGGSHVWQLFVSPYYVKIRPLLPGWSLGPRPHSPSKSKSTTRSREVWFNILVPKATQLIGPHKTWHAVSTQLKAFHLSQHGAVLNRHRRGYSLGTSELPQHSPHPSLPSEPLSPNCPARSHP